MDKNEIKNTMVKVVTSDMDVNLKADVLLALRTMYHEMKEPERQNVVEGDVVKINNKIFVIAQIFDFTGYGSAPGADRFMAVLYNPMSKRLGFAFQSLYEDPGMCKLISHIDPKIIFKEDIKCA